MSGIKEGIDQAVEFRKLREDPKQKWAKEGCPFADKSIEELRALHEFYQKAITDFEWMSAELDKYPNLEDDEDD